MSNIYEVFLRAAQRKPSKTAVVCGDTSTSYRGLLKAVDDMAEHYLASMGGLTSDVFLHTELPNDLESVVKLLAAAKLGIALMPARESVNMLRSNAMLRDEPEPPYLLLETSGTTGAPKLISLPQRVKIMRAAQAARLYGVTADDYVLAGTPLRHSLAQRLAFTALLIGATVELLPNYSASLWLQAMRRSSFTMCVPTQLRELATSRQHTPRLRAVVSSSALLPALLREDLLNLYSAVQLYECYGTSEVGIAASMPLEPSGAVGRKLPEVDLDIVNAEVLVRSPYAFAGYAGRPDLTRCSITTDGYFKTGDTGRLGSTGRLYLGGRISGRIKVGGVGVMPEEVDAVLHNAGLVTCAAFGTPDTTLGEVVAVAVAGLPELTLRGIQHVCRHLTPAAIPRKIVHVKELPRTETGKLLRRELKC